MARTLFWGVVFTVIATCGSIGAVSGSAGLVSKVEGRVSFRHTRSTAGHRQQHNTCMYRVVTRDICRTQVKLCHLERTTSKFSLRTAAINNWQVGGAR
jgi:hypothetical protein